MNFSFEYATLANYSPRGKSDLSLLSKNTCLGIKSGQPRTLRGMSFRLSQIQETTGFYDDFFGPQTVFVPMPGSAPLLPNGEGLWAPKLIAEELVNAQFGVSIAPLLERRTAVRKSATAPVGERPTIEMHLKTMSLNQTVLMESGRRIIMVDDVLTKGRTMCAAYILLREAFPDTPISAFAVFRTQGLIENIAVFTEPTIGSIIYDGYDCHREP